jgi:multisubunit Na+/H+ antiporter MnhG subunit
MASIGRRMISVGTLLGAIGLVRIQVLIRRAHAAHPQEMGHLLARLGYSEKSVDDSYRCSGQS